MVKNMLVLDTTSSSSLNNFDSAHRLGFDAQPQSSFAESPTEFNAAEDIVDAPTRLRKDSGYSEEPRRPIYRLSPDSGTLTFLELQRSTDDSSIRRTSTLRHGRSSRRNSSAASTGQPKHRSSHARLKDNERINHTESLHRQQASPPSSNDSIHATPRTLSQKISDSLQVYAEDPFLVHQKSISIVQASELPYSTISSNGTSRSTSILMPESLNEQSTRSDSSAMSSVVDLEAHTSSPFYNATNIDWTDPDTRRKAYEKHDRAQRGFRRLLKKLTPRKWQTEHLQFYDGNSDAGSVRRYRLDIDETQSCTRTNSSKELGKILKHASTCFPISRSTSRVRSG